MSNARNVDDAPASPTRPAPVVSLAGRRWAFARNRASVWLLIDRGASGVVGVRVACDPSSGRAAAFDARGAVLVPAANGSALYELPDAGHEGDAGVRSEWLRAGRPTMASAGARRDAREP